MFMAGTGVGARGCSQGPSSGSSTAGCNPRKFSEKIALHTQRQAEDTAAFQEVMMDITSTKIQVQRARQARNLAPYYGGSLPNVNQIVRAACDTQGQVSYHTEHSCAVRRHLMSDQSHRERRLSPPGRPNRRHTDSAPYHSVHQSPPPGSYCRRNWPNSCTTDKGQEIRLPTTALNRTNSDSALHTTVRNTHIGDQMSSAQPLNPRNKRSAQVFPYPAPLIEENLPEEGRPLKRDCKKLSEVPSGSGKTSSQHVTPTPSQQGSTLTLPSSLNMSGSLPDLSSLHLPSPQPAGLELDPLGQATCLASSSSSDHLPGGLTHPGLSTDDAYHLPGLSPMPASLSNPLLQSSSSPNIQSSLSSNSLPNSLSSASLRLSLSNSSLKSSLSNQSLLSSLSSSSLSNQSLQSAASQCSYSSGIGGSRSCSSSSLSCSPRTSNQSHPPHSSSSRKRNQLSPLILPSGGSLAGITPNSSPLLCPQHCPPSLSQMSRDSRPPAYPYNQPQHAGPNLSQHLPYTAAEGHLHHQLPVVEPLAHSANHQQLPPPHQPPMPNQPALLQPGQHQPYQPSSFPKRQAPQGHHAQPPPQPQSHLLKHLQAQSPPPSAAPPQLQPYHAQDQVAVPHPPPGGQQYPWHQQQQHQYPCELSQPLHHHHHQHHHTGPQAQQLLPQPIPHQQHQSQWPSCRLQPDQQALHHPHQQQHQQQQQQLQHQQHHHDQHQRHPSWSSPSPAVLSGPNQTTPWLQETNLHGRLPSVGALPTHESLRVGTPPRAQSQWRSRSQLQDAVAGSAHSGSPQKVTQPPQSRTSSQSGTCLDTGICLNNESYTGLHLTPSQTKALSQQLGHLCREPGSVAVPDTGMQQSANAGREANPFQNFGPGQDQKHSNASCHSLTDAMLTDAASWLDQEIAGFPASILDLDEDALELSILRDEEFSSESAV